MEPFLFDLSKQRDSKKIKTIHYFDLVKTQFFIKRAMRLLYNYTATGCQVLFVGTHERSYKVIKEIARLSYSAYINKKWLGGILTNWVTVSGSIETLLELNRLEQTGLIKFYGKKEQSRMMKQKMRLFKAIGGLQFLKKRPDVVLIVGQHEEYKAVDECRRLKIRSITLLNSGCDPRKSDFFIPANDHSRAAIQTVLKYLGYSIRLGNRKYESWLTAESEFINKYEDFEEARHKRLGKKYLRGLISMTDLKKKQIYNLNDLEQYKKRAKKS
jgi:small subunit ribosomal protein S2